MRSERIRTKVEKLYILYEFPAYHNEENRSAVLNLPDFRSESRVETESAFGQILEDSKSYEPIA